MWQRERGVHVVDTSSVAPTLGQKAGVRADQTPGKFICILFQLIAVYCLA